MNTNDLNKRSEIEGKSKTYMPDGIFYTNDTITEDLENVILIHCYFGEMKNRFFDKVEFHEKLSADKLNEMEKHPMVYVLKTTKEESKSIVLDLKQGPAYKQ